MMLASFRNRVGVASSALLCALLLSSCAAGDDGQPPGGGGDPGAGGAAPSPCDLTEPAVVAEVFGGSVDGEMPGPARNCDYVVQGGAAAIVVVYYYGTGDDWDGVRGGYENNRGPLTDAAGVGDDAFHPADVGAEEIVVRAGDVVFAVGLSIGDRSADAAARVRDLAVRIADSLG